MHGCLAGIIRTLLFEAGVTPTPYDIQVVELIQVGLINYPCPG